MEIIEKRPYELSLWEDLLTVEQDGSIQTDERKLCVISTDTIKSPIAAFDIQLNQKVNGEKTLTFSLNMTYWDEEEQKNLTNPYLTKLVNERKVKLKWKEKWYDFVIKGVSEDSKSKVFTYTAKDQLVQELAKNGYNIQFDQELENSIQTARNFVEEILRGTDWEVGECEPLYENTVESLYEFRAKQNLAVKAVIDDEDFTIKAGSTVFVPYSIIKNKTDRLQLLYSSTWNSGALPKDDEGTLLEGELYFKNYYIDNVWTDGDIPAVLTDPILRNDCRGRHYVRIAEKVYDSNIDKYVNVYKRSGEEYKDKIYYGFTKTDYLSQTIVENLISNNSAFTNTSGWKQAAKTEETDVTAMPPNLSTTNSVEDVLKNPDLPFESLLVLPPHTFSSGFHDNRAKVKELIAGDKYVLDIKYADDYDLTQFAKFTKIDICEYVIENSYYRPKKNGLVYFTANINNDNNIDGGHTFLECQYTLPATELNESKIGVFLYADGQKPVKIKSIALYRKLEVEDELVQPNQIVFENKDLVVTNYYYYEKVETPYDLSSLHYTAIGLAPNPEYIQCYDETYQKKRSLTASKSNRFNLLQKVSEIFECWLDFQVEHYPDGRIKSKKIGLREFIGDNNAAGFKYGVNLGPIKRKVESDTIVTKMIVEANANEFAENGFCTISRAPLNPSGTNVVYNFDYYTSQGLLSAESAQAALHSYYQATKAISDELNALQNTKIAKEKQIVENDAKAFFEIEKAEAAQKTLMESEEELVRVFQRPYSWFVKPNTTDPAEQKLYNDYLKNTQCTALLQQIIHCKKIIASYEDHESGPWALEAIVQSLRAEVEDINAEIQKCINRLTEKENDFHNKVGRFIQEGNWISEEYTDDNLYYLDSLSTLYTSSRPKVSYTIDVFDLSGIEGYENYRFKIGDKTFVQDPEFFGWTSKDGIRVPRREEVVVSETNECIDNISKTSIKVQNYKTQFEDLFSRIAAATESLQYNTGRYEKFSGVIDSEGAITQEALQQAVDKNGLVISGTGKQTVTCDDRGVTTIDNINPSSQVRIVGGGVFVSDDGGLTWSTGMTGEGINADVITSGRVDTGKVNIMSGGQKTHVWDDKGVSSYKTEYDNNGVIKGVDVSTFVRQDEFGIYGIKGNASFSARENNGGDPIGKIEGAASYALTWDGFMLKSSDDDGRVEIDSEDDIVVYDKDDNRRVKIGRLGNDSYGMRVDAANEKFAYIGITDNPGDTDDNTSKAIIVAQGGDSKRFVVLEDGSMYARGAIIDGNVNITEGYLHLMSEDDQKKSQVIIDPAGIGDTDYNFAALYNGEPVLALDNKGNAQFTGTVTANAGSIGGWHLVNNSLSSVENSATGGSGVLLSPTGIKYDGLTSKEEEYTILAGKKFGITTDGIVYAKNFQMAGGSITWGASGASGVTPPGLDDMTDVKTGIEGASGLASAAKEAADKATVKAEAANSTAAAAQTKADGIVSDYLGAGGETDVTPEHVISPYIGGGYLHITNGDNSVTINPNNITQVDNKIFSVKIGGEEKIGFDTNGNAEFSGSITATSGQIGDLNIVDGGLALTGGQFQLLEVFETQYYHISSLSSDSNNDGKLDFTVTNWGGETETPKYHYKVTNPNAGLKFSSKVKVDSVFLVRELPTRNDDYDYFYRTQNLNTTEGGTAQIVSTYFAGATEETPIYVIAVRNPLTFSEEGTSTLAITRDGQITASGGQIGGWQISENGFNASYEDSSGSYEVKLFQSYPDTVQNWRILVGAGTDSKKGFRVDRDGNLELAAAPTVDSDVNLKNSIEELPSNYSELFDNLRPVRFKYNNGSSDRYHTGLIAQELQEAIVKANLTEKEVAAICTRQDSHSSIRYEELIALCIKEIQDLKKEVSTLKTQIEQLQS